MAAARRQTIYDLSKKLGIGPTTISAVLNGTWKERRISAVTAQLILAHVNDAAYMPNMHAQGLRKGASGLIGLIIPNYDALFFGSVANAFEAHVRSHGKCPLVVSGNRDPKREIETAKTLLGYSIEALIVCGATDPDGIHTVCAKFGTRHINIDLAGTKAPSVVSDNYNGGKLLAESILKSLRERGARLDDIRYVGGLRNRATADRVSGFRAAMENLGITVPAGHVSAIGYDAASALSHFEDLKKREAMFPNSFFIEGPPNYEGLLQFLSRNPRIDARKIVVGCYDLSPIASYSVVETWMVRQDASEMIRLAFDILEKGDPDPGTLVHVMPELIPPHRLPTER